MFAQYNGQLAASPGTALLAAATQADPLRTVGLTLYNTSGVNTETISLTVANNAGTARTVCPLFTLGPNEYATVQGLTLDSQDALTGTTTHGTTVDYRVLVGPGGPPFSVVTYDKNGQVKQVLASAVNFTITGLLTESVTNGITAFATGGQASAVQLVSEINRVTVCATAGDSVKLMAATAGLTIIVINKGAAPLAVFPATGDAIDGQSANASVTQMVNSMVIFTCTVAGAWDTEGLATGYAGSLQTLSFTNAITAFATGGQGSAVALTSLLNRITICATAGDSVKLPAATAGLGITVFNDGATAADVFPATGDNINGLAANTAIRLKPGAGVTYYCEVAGTWNAQYPSLRFFSLAASAGVAAQAETIFATNQYTINANTLKPGSKIKVRAQGTVTTANGTLDIRVRYGGVGGVLLADTGNAITPSNADIFTVDATFIVTDVGGTGHAYGTFAWSIGTAGTGTTRQGKTASIAIDTTADKVLCLTQQNGTGAGSITLDYLDVEIL